MIHKLSLDPVMFFSSVHVTAAIVVVVTVVEAVVAAAEIRGTTLFPSCELLYVYFDFLFTTLN